MAIFDLFGKKPAAATSDFLLKCEFHPYRLQAHKNDYVDLEIDLTNVSRMDQLTSVVLVLPKPLGIDKTGLSQQKELRLGTLRAAETRHLLIPVWATQRTEPGNYAVRVYAISNYHDYGHVLNEARKIVELRVV